MRNVTVSVPDDVYRDARIAAAQRGRSVSALVAEFLQDLSKKDREFERLEALQRHVQEQITDFSAADRLEREQVHERALR